MEIANWQKVLDRLRVEQIPFEQAIAAIEYYGEIKYRLEPDKAPGVLYNYLMKMQPGDDPRLGWPGDEWKLAVEKDLEIRKGRNRQLLVAAATAKQDHAADRRRYQELEQKFGPQLDALPRWKQITLAKRVLSPFLLERFSRNPGAAGARFALLEYLETKQQSESKPTS